MDQGLAKRGSKKMSKYKGPYNHESTASAPSKTAKESLAKNTKRSLFFAIASFLQIILGIFIGYQFDKKNTDYAAYLQLSLEVLQRSEKLPPEQAAPLQEWSMSVLEELNPTSVPLPDVVKKILRGEAEAYRKSVLSALDRFLSADSGNKKKLEDWLKKNHPKLSVDALRLKTYTPELISAVKRFGMDQ